MLLSSFNICHYLLDKGYVDYKSIVNGDFTVHQFSGRNNNFIVNKHTSKPLFVKQSRTLDGERAASVYLEASCYWLANNEHPYKGLANFLPKYYDFDYINNILLVEGIENSKNLYDFYAEKQTLSANISQHLAELLSSYHLKVLSNIKGSESEHLFRKATPFIFKLGEANRKLWWKGKSEAEKQMLALIDSDHQFVQLISSASTLWEADSLIHGDIKSTNFLVSEKNEEVCIRLIDWELADIGDACWDLAAVFNMYIIFWIYSQDFSNNIPYFSKPYHGYSQEDIQPSIRSFWDKYCELMDVSQTIKKKQLLKIVNFCALRLIQSCYETVVDSSYGSLSPYAVQMLQLSTNMLKSPEQAIEDVFSIKT